MNHGAPTTSQACDTGWRHARVKRWFVGQCRSGGMPVGAKLPTERELARVHCVSRGTVRRALAELEQEGRISREQGRGTYVRNIEPVVTSSTANDKTAESSDAHWVVLLCPSDSNDSSLIDRIRSHANRAGVPLAVGRVDQDSADLGDVLGRLVG